MSGNPQLAGIGFMLGTLAIYATVNVIVKFLSDTHAVTQLVFFRQALALPIILAAVLIVEGIAALRTRNLRLHALRGLLGTGGTVGIFYGLANLPLADAVSIGFVAPILTAGLSVPLLGERVGWQRWAVVGLGLVGALMIVQPTSNAFDPASLVVVGGCVLLAVHVLVGRRLSREEPSATIAFYYVLGSSVMSLGLAPVGWQPIVLSEVPLLLLLGVLNGVGLIMLTEAFRRAQAATLAPLDYLHLVFAAAFGFLIWDEIPTLNVVVGAAIVVVAGIATLRVESKT